MPERLTPRIAATALFFAACGGTAQPPPDPPPQPGPIVLYRPPQPTPTPAPPPPRPPSTASGAPTPPPPPTVSEPATHCALSGRAIFPANTLIQTTAGRPVARFSGAEATVSISAVTLANSARAYVETGSGRGNLRVRGFVEARKVPAYTAQAVPIFAGHLSIGERRAVSIASATADGKIKIEKTLTAPLQQTFTAWTTCSALTLTPGTAPGWLPAGDARGYVAKKGTLELFDAPQGNSVGALYKAPASSGLLFFSTEQSAGWVRVEMHGEIIANGWARASDLTALPRGETMDQLAAPTATRTPARLIVPGAPRVVRVTKDVVVRGVANDAEIPIGLLEPDAEVYVVDMMAGWASVMPRSLDIVPPEGGQFWVKKSELGI